MKRILIALSAIFAITLLGTTSAVLANNKNVSNEYPAFAESKEVKVGETVDGAFYGAGNTVSLAGTIKGDVYCAGQNIVISGVVEGDVYCAGQNVTISGEVKGDVRVAGQNVILDGTIAGSATTFGQTVTLSDDSTVGRDLNGAAQNLTLNGTVGRDVVAAGSGATINGSIGRNVSGEYEQLTVGEGAAVAGSLQYTSRNNAGVAPGTVTGQVKRHVPESREQYNKSDTGSLIGMAAFLVFSMLIISMVLVLVAPRLVNTIATNGGARVWLSLLVGFFALGAVPLLSLFIAFTVVGIPLAVLIMTSWFVVLMLSGPVFAFYLGKLIMSGRSTSPILIMFIGSVVLLLSYLVPVLNLLVAFAVLTVGTGMIILEATRRYPKPVYKISN